MVSGLGTHMDAPAHCLPGGRTIDTLELHELITLCVMIDISAKAHERYVAWGVMERSADLRI